MDELLDMECVLLLPQCCVLDTLWSAEDPLAWPPPMNSVARGWAAISRAMAMDFSSTRQKAGSSLWTGTVAIWAACLLAYCSGVSKQKKGGERERVRERVIVSVFVRERECVCVCECVSVCE